MYGAAKKKLNVTSTASITLLDKLILKLFGTAKMKAKLSAKTKAASASNVGFSGSLKLATKSLWGFIKAQLILIKTMLMTPLGLLVFVGALAVGFKKLMGATDTTNDTVARLQVAFHAMGRSIKNLVKFLVDGTKALFEFLGPLGKVLKVALAVAFPIVGIG